MTAANKWAHLNDLTDILYSSQCNSFNCSSLDAINTRASNTQISAWAFHCLTNVQVDLHHNTISHLMAECYCNDTVGWISYHLACELILPSFIELPLPDVEDSCATFAPTDF